MATLLSCQSISKAYGMRELFVDLSVSFADDEHVGLVGPNGAGKTTLLKMMSGLEIPDRGQVDLRRSAQVVYVPQEDSFATGHTVDSVLEEAIADQDLELHERDTKVKTTLSKFGFRRDHNVVTELSGGWRKRLALARAIICRPDLLLIDEPTNHLDIESILWLEEVLRTAPFALVVVSHDRYFLEQVTHRVLELNPLYPDGYFSVSGTYSLFLEKRIEFLESQRVQQLALANTVRRETAFLKSHAKARRTKSKSRVDEAYRLKDELRELHARNSHNTSAGIDFDGTGRETHKLLDAKDISKELGGKQLFRQVSLTLSPGMRLGILGANGSGKSTLIRVLTGELPPDQGTVTQADNLSVVVFDQMREKLNQDATLRDAISPASDSVDFRGQPVHITAWAKRFLFREDQLNMPVGELSGGEQARILIARLMLRPADVLVLDEPTNDLDIASLDILTESLRDFPGALVLVTHDRFMLDTLCTEVLGLDGSGGADRYANYSQWLMAKNRLASNDPKSASGKTRRPAKKPDRGGLTASEQKELQDMELTIQSADEQVDRCRKAMDDPTIASNAEETAKRWNALDAARKQVEGLYARWEELEAKVAG